MAKILYVCWSIRELYAFVSLETNSKKTWECRTKAYSGLLESQLKQGVTKLRGNCGEKRGQKSTKK